MIYDIVTLFLSVSIQSCIFIVTRNVYFGYWRKILRNRIYEYFYVPIL